MYSLTWQGQALTVRYAPDWLGDTSGHLEILSDDKRPHLISQTGYRSHFIRPEIIDDAGGPVAYVEAWLEALDDGKPKQLSLF